MKKMAPSEVEVALSGLLLCECYGVQVVFYSVLTS